MKLVDDYADLKFTPEQLFLSNDETVTVARDFWGNSPEPSAISDRDRAFVQAALLVAVDKSEKAGYLFDLYSSAMKAAPSASVKKLVTGFAKRAAKRWFRKYIDDTPKISAVGKAAVQYSEFTFEWRMRMSLEDPDELTNFLIGAQ
jgi:hypothetical protein